jgi:uncharacterized protein (DUF2141 family)
MFKKIIFVCALLWITNNSFADNINAAIKINNVNINGGSVYVAVYSNENDYKNEQAFTSFILQPDNTVLTYFLDLPEGEYVVSVFQDKNNNGKLDTGIFGIPSEPVGKTNYNLKGSPGDFNKLKIPVHSTSATLIVNMGKVKLL